MQSPEDGQQSPNVVTVDGTTGAPPHQAPPRRTPSSAGAIHRLLPVPSHACSGPLPGLDAVAPSTPPWDAHAAQWRGYNIPVVDISPPCLVRSFRRPQQNARAAAGREPDAEGVRAGHGLGFGRVAFAMRPVVGIVAVLDDQRLEAAFAQKR